MAGIYIHIPFCKQLCNYCDFYFTVSEKRKKEMLDAIFYEIEERRGYLRNEKIDTLYFGGGTPTVCRPEEIQGFIDLIKLKYGNPYFSEITIEANPEDLTVDYLKRLARTEITRISVGVQSFIDQHLNFFNRRHNAETAYDSIINAKTHGFSDINIDLIYGIPGMTDNQWRENLNRFIELDIPHLSAYTLTLENKTVFGKMARKGKFSVAQDEEILRHYNILEKITSDNGFEHYEVSNFAKPGMRAIHNSNYWKGMPYIGFGPSAHSFDGENSRQWNVASNNRYLSSIYTGNYFESEVLTETDKYNEFVMVSLRTSEGMDIQRLRKKFGEEKSEKFLKIFKKINMDGLMEKNEGNFFIRPENFLISDMIISEFFLV